MTLKAAIFDLDDTIYPEIQYVQSGYRSISLFLNRQRQTNVDYAGWLWQRFIGGESANAFGALSEHFKLNLTDTDTKKLVEVYRNHAPQIKPRDGVIELLEKLRACRIKTGIISDGFLPAQKYKLNALQIADLFDEVIFTESLSPDREFWKPSPKAYEMMADKLSAPHKSCCYISDNLIKDFLAPNQLGWLTILFRTEDQIHTAPNDSPQAAPQHTVNSIAQLQKLLLPHA